MTIDQLITALQTLRDAHDISGDTIVVIPGYDSTYHKVDYPKMRVAITSTESEMMWECNLRTVSDYQLSSANPLINVVVL